MTSPLDNPSAFPEHPLEHDHYWHVGSNGMTLRDYFAGQALAGLCADEAFQMQNAKLCVETGVSSPAGMADAAYELADAMLAHRSKQP